jgi:hypothetical protein
MLIRIRKPKESFNITIGTQKANNKVGSRSLKINYNIMRVLKRNTSAKLYLF